jgi:diacylglycerol kinase family enzyme
MEMALVRPEGDPTNPHHRRSYAAKFLTKEVNKIVNLCLLKHHQSAGVTLALKNLSHGSLDDGRLDLMWADALGRAAVLRHASRVMAGTHLDLPVVHVASSSWVEFECDEPLPVQVDGDVLGAGLQRLKAEIVPGALRLWC